MDEETVQIDLENGTQELIKTGKCAIKFNPEGKLILDCEGTDPAELSSFEIKMVQKVVEAERPAEIRKDEKFPPEPAQTKEVVIPSIKPKKK